MLYKQVVRLDLNSTDATVLNEALDAVIDQPRGARVGNHAALCFTMAEIFGIKLNKRDAVENALFALWREDSIMNIVSDDTYIAELQQERKIKEYYLEQADMLSST